MTNDLLNPKRVCPPSDLKALEEEVKGEDFDGYAKDIASHGVFEEAIIQVLSEKNLLALAKDNVEEKV